jgi:hypothetical protein
LDNCGAGRAARAAGHIRIQSELARAGRPCRARQTLWAGGTGTGPGGTALGRGTAGHPDYAALREGIALAKDGPDAALPLDGLFALHPAMPNFARLYKSGQATIVHAVATGYRERSHFDAAPTAMKSIA